VLTLQGVWAELRLLRSQRDSVDDQMQRFEWALTHCNLDPSSQVGGWMKEGRKELEGCPVLGPMHLRETIVWMHRVWELCLQMGGWIGLAL